MSKRDAWTEGYRAVAAEYNARLAREAQAKAKPAKPAK